MAHNRAPKSTGNKQGIELVIGGSDPLKQKLLLLRESQIAKIKELSYKLGKSESKIFRALIDEHLDSI